MSQMNDKKHCTKCTEQDPCSDCVVMAEPVMTAPSRLMFNFIYKKCDCGAEKAKTTHSDWCSMNKEK